ncbi:MAG TPA: LCP family protein [Nakamurella sp.]
MPSSPAPGGYPPPRSTGSPPPSYRSMGADVPPAFRGAGPPGGPPAGPPPTGPGGGDGEPHRRTNRALLVTRIVALVVAAVVLLGAGVAYAFTDTLQTASGTSDAAGNAGDAGVISAEGLTFMLVGSDARTDADGNPLSAEELAQVGTEDDGGGLNTDTIMLVHVPKGGGRATAVSIPRDTWIGSRVTDQIVGPYANGTEGPYRPNKVNSFYATAKAYTEQYLVSQGVSDQARIERESNEAGRTQLIRVIQALSGLKVDHYAEVNLLGFYLLSNAIGGVPVCLNEAVDDPWSGANFPAGEQQVQGTAALAFVRQRHGLPGGDLDRVGRQQAFLHGAADKILSVGTLTNPTKLNDLITAVDRSVIFDKGFDVLTFAEQITNLSSGNIDFETLPTTGAESSTEKDALATDPAQIKAFFQGIVGGGTDAGTSAAADVVAPAEITVDVNDGTIADGVTARAAELVTDGGFELGSLGVIAGTRQGNEQAVTEFHYSGDEAAAQQVQQAFGGLGKLVNDSAVKANHVLVLVGTDLEVPSGLRGGAAALVPAAVAAPAAAVSLAASVPCVN